MLLVVEPFPSGNYSIIFVLGWYLGGFNGNEWGLKVLIEDRGSPRPNTWYG